MLRRPPLGAGSAPTVDAGSAVSIAGLLEARWKSPVAGATNDGAPPIVPVPLVTAPYVGPIRL